MKNMKLLVLFGLVAFRAALAVKEGEAAVDGDVSSDTAAAKGSTGSLDGSGAAAPVGASAADAMAASGGDISPDGRPVGTALDGEASGVAGEPSAMGPGRAPAAPLTPAQLKRRFLTIGGIVVVLGVGFVTAKKILDYLRKKEEQKFLEELFANNSVIAQDDASQNTDIMVV